jgi:hypothetical protein
MHANTPCPDPGCFRDLLGDRLSSDQQAAVTSHLDTCDGCQQALEHLAAGESNLPESLFRVNEDEPPSDSAYWPALAALDAQPTVALADAQMDPDVKLDFLDPPEEPGTLGSLGHYDVLSVAGRGGMGMVLHALDTHLDRHVALKVLDPRLARDEAARMRFCREARSAAAITHEHVVAVHSVEHEEGKDLPFLVMQLIEGESLEARLLREGRLQTPEIVRIGTQVAAGLCAAHEKGLVHRDIKPGNILLEKDSDRVKLTDFGLARAREDVRLTHSGMVAGTPLYMAPEQARGDEVDHRSDLFSLGVVLFEMATGVPPFAGKTPLAVLKRLTEERHPQLAQLNPTLPQWLVEAIDRLLEKDPTRRFGSAREVHDLFEAHWMLLQTPAKVCPQMKKAARARRWARVKLAVAATGLALTSALLGAFVVARLRPAVPPAETGPSAALRAVLPGNAGPVWAVAFTPGADQVVMAIDDGTLKFWDVRGEKVRATLNAHKGPIWGMALSPDGSLLATGSDDTTAKLWDFASRKELFTLRHTGGLRAVAFDPSGKTLATASRNGAVRLWNVADGKEKLATRGHAGIVTGVAFSPDGKTLVTGSGDKTVRLWDTATGEERLSLGGHPGGVYAVAFGKDGTVASGGWDKVIRLYDSDSGSPLGTLEGHEGDVWGLAFSPDGRWLASADENRLVLLWDVARRKQIATLRGHSGTVYSVAFSADGRLLASGGRDGTVRLWSVADLVSE